MHHRHLHDHDNQQQQLMNMYILVKPDVQGLCCRNGPVQFHRTKRPHASFGGNGSLDSVVVFGKQSAIVLRAMKAGIPEGTGGGGGWLLSLWTSGTMPVCRIASLEILSWVTSLYRAASL